MAKYQAPEGYVLDSGTGLYYTQIIAEDEQGNKSQVVTWFNADTGEYRQDVYPIEGSVAQASETETSEPVKTEPRLIPAPPEPAIALPGGKKVATVQPWTGPIVSKNTGAAVAAAPMAAPQKKGKGLKVFLIILAICAFLGGLGFVLYKFVLKDFSFDKFGSGEKTAETEVQTTDTVTSAPSEVKNTDQEGESDKDALFDLYIIDSSNIELVFHYDKSPFYDGRVPEYVGVKFPPYNFIYNAYEGYDSPRLMLMKLKDQPESDGSYLYNLVGENKQYWFEGNDIHLQMDMSEFEGAPDLLAYSGEFTFLYGFSQDEDYRTDYRWEDFLDGHTSGYCAEAPSSLAGTKEVATDSVAEEAVVDAGNYDKDSIEYALNVEGQFIPNGEEYGPNGYWIGCIYGSFVAMPQTSFDEEYFKTEITPCLRLYENGTYELDCSMGGDYWTSRGTYTVIDPEYEMAEIIVTLFDCSKGPGAGTGNAVVVFSDASDYPQFLSDGFGYMGEYGAPYQFERE